MMMYMYIVQLEIHVHVCMTAYTQQVQNVHTLRHVHVHKCSLYMYIVHVCSKCDIN